MVGGEFYKLASTHAAVGDAAEDLLHGSRSQLRVDGLERGRTA